MEYYVAAQAKRSDEQHSSYRTADETKAIDERLVELLEPRNLFLRPLRWIEKPHLQEYQAQLEQSEVGLRFGAKNSEVVCI